MIACQIFLHALFSTEIGTFTSANFDTTLIVCLLRNLPPRESAPVTGFDNLPRPNDTSTGADIARVKWYRNKLVHSEDGKLCPGDFSQFWGDLEGAIGRLGGPPMLNEAQSAQHIVLDGSLIRMLNVLGNCEKDVHNLHLSQENHIKMINDLENHRIIKEQQINQLNSSLQKGETETSKLSTELSEYKETLDRCTEDIEACKREIEKKEETLKGIKEKVVDKQNLVDVLTNQLGSLECTYDKKFKEIDDKLVEHDEQMASCVKEIDKMKKTHYHTDDKSDESKQKRLMADTKALIEEDVREDTFMTTKAVTDGLLLLKQNGVLLITGHAGTGKSRIGRHVLQMYCTENKSHESIKLNTLEEWDRMVSREDNVVVLLDDIFGETNCIYNREKDAPILDMVHAYVCKGNIKVVITIRDTVKRQCQQLFDNHRLFKFDFIDLSSDKYELSQKEKKTILKKYMKTFRQSDYIKSTGFVDHHHDPILKTDEVSKITGENPVKGFPLVVYQFVHNDKYFKLGSQFFDRPTDAILDEMIEIREKGEDDRKVMIQYAVMVFTAINENCINPDDYSSVTEVPKIIDAIYGESIKLKKCHISDAVKKLKGSYLVNIPNQKSYRLHHPILQESVILSFAKIDDENINKIIPLISWSFCLKMIKPESYKEKEGEVVLAIPANSYKLLANRLADIYMAEIRGFLLAAEYFLRDFINTELFQQDYCLLLPYLLEALEKKDIKDKHTENMTRYQAMDICYLFMNNKDVFLTNLLVYVAKTERQFEMYNFILKTFNQVIKNSNNYVSIEIMKRALIQSLYEICSSTKDLRSVKATLEILEENKIPVLLDQCVNLTEIELPIERFKMEYDSEPICIFLTLCIWNAYKEFNVPVLKCLLSKYKETPFDVNLFLGMIYRKEWVKKHEQHNLSYKPLKWMTETFADQALLDTACKYQMFNTVEYLESASRCKSIDPLSCLKTMIEGVNDSFIGFQPNYVQEFIDFLLTQIDCTSKELNPVVISVFQKHEVPDCVFDAFLPVCLNNAKLLSLACINGHFHVVNLIIENSLHIQFEDLQSALLSACKDRGGSYSLHAFNRIPYIELEKLKIVKYIVGKFGFEHFDLKAACQQACDSSQFKIVEWFVQNIDLTFFDVDFITSSALKRGQFEILEDIMNKTGIARLNKMEVLKSVSEHFTVRCSTKILQIVSTIWNNTDDKEELNMEEIVNTGYKSKCFELLMWIHENCHPHVSIDARRLLMSACEDCRIDVSKRVVQAFEQTTLDIDGGELFLLTCDKKFDLSNEMIYEHWIAMLHWILATFQIKRLDIISGVLKLVRVDKNLRNELTNLLVSILENNVRSLNTEDMEDMKVMIKISLKQKYYDIVNWFLENENCCSFDKQKILNKACSDAEIGTVRLLRKYFYCLDMNQAMNHIFSTSPYYFYSFNPRNQEPKCLNDHPTVACLNLLWKEVNHDSIDIRTIVSAACQDEQISNDVMTWILLNLPIDRIPINLVLITCCQQSKINHVKYIFHKLDNEQLEVEDAFVKACLASDPDLKWNFGESLCVVDFLFQKLQDKTSSLSLVLTELLCKNNFDLILYFLQAGYCRKIDMKNLMNLACRNGHIRLVQWILANVEHKELDIKSAFVEACKIIHFGHHNRDQKQLQCVAIMWHYIQDINMFEIETVLKTMTPESQSNTADSDSDDAFDSDSDDGLKTWLLYIKKINQRIPQSGNTLLNTEENINQHSQHLYDVQCCLENSQDNDDSNGNIDYDDCPSAMNKMCSEKEEQT
ncbi:unnamed protein product [Mytilus coruscus]|uniref:Uncharacterized protein n=1 Tax=Mytilus coruscus TaxID=42192 RepID=A0A6J8F0S7_MYTCO|nr:unnamed protein product [Mytilus coruscus]